MHMYRHTHKIFCSKSSVYSFQNFKKVIKKSTIPPMRHVFTLTCTIKIMIFHVYMYFIDLRLYLSNTILKIMNHSIVLWN